MPALGIVCWVLWFLLALLQITAFLQGLENWFGLHWAANLAVFVVIVTIVPFGEILTSVIGFYGAWHGWGWPWWRAALLCLPFAAVSFCVPGPGKVIVRMLRARMLKREPPPPLELTNSLSEDIRQDASECIEALKGHWLRFYNGLERKDDLPLSTQVEAFAGPAADFVGRNYPRLLSGGSNIFWLLVATAILQSGTHSREDINSTLDEIKTNILQE